MMTELNQRLKRRSMIGATIALASGLPCFILVCAVLSSACSNAPLTYPRPAAVDEHDASTKSFVDGSKIDRAVELDTGEGVVGRISSVKVDPSSGDILIADTRVSNSVVRFSASGEYLRRYRLSEISEHNVGAGESLMDFDVRSDGAVVLVSNQRLLAIGNRGVMAVATIPVGAQQVVTVGSDSLVYLAGAAERAPVAAVQVFDRELKLRDSFHPFDPRMQRLHYVSAGGAVDATSRSIVVADPYRPRISVYDNSRRAQYSWDLGEPPRGFDELWSSPTLTKEREDEIIGKTDRVRMVRAVGPDVLLWRSGVAETVLLNPERRAALRFRGFDPLHLLDRNGVGVIVDRIIGSYKSGLIALVFSPHTWTALSQEYPELQTKTEHGPHPGGSYVLFVAVHLAGLGESE
jgi:hypothetical protein